MIAFEDLTPGRVFELGSVTVDRDEMVAFARRFDPQPFHLDEEAGGPRSSGGCRPRAGTPPGCGCGSTSTG